MVDSAIINAKGDSELVDDGNRHHKLNNTHISEETMTCAHVKPYLKKI